MRKRFVTTTIITLILCTLCLLCFSACINNTPSTIEVTEVIINKAALTLEQGETETITAAVSPDNATDKTVYWTSSDETIATVDNGKITAIKAGTATITAKSGDKIAKCVVTVTEPVILIAGKTLICTALDIEVTDSSKFDEDTLNMLLSPENPYRRIYLNSRFSFKDNNEVTIYFGEYGAFTGGQDHADGTYTQTNNTVKIGFNDLNGTLNLSAATSEFRLNNVGYDIIFDLEFVS